MNGLLEPEEFEKVYNKIVDAVLIDLRTPAEYESGHIENAINLDYRSDNFEDTVMQLDKGKTYFVYCRSGRRSSSAAKLMETAGIKNIYDLKGGINAWKKHGKLKVVSE